MVQRYKIYIELKNFPLIYRVSHFSSAKIRKIADSAKDFCVNTQKSFVELCWVFKNQWLCVVDRGDGEGIERYLSPLYSF